MKKQLFFAAILALPAVASATLINGGNWNGNNLTVANGDTLKGTFTNVGNFHLPAGDTIYVSPGTILSISATCINVEGVILGKGAGYTGGPVNPNFSSSGINGSGPGGGIGGQHGGCVHGTGGGGGAYGGNGGNSSRLTCWANPATPAFGGNANGTLSLPGIDMGSGGASGATHCSGGGFGIAGAGGNGGGAVELISSTTIFVSGTINVNGNDGVPGQVTTYGGASGGAGSGGGINISATQGGIVTGTLLADGGKGADASQGYQYANSGGGGSGGRIKFGNNICTLGATMSVLGGMFGLCQSPECGGNITQATAGANGTLDGGTTNCATTINGPQTVCEGDSAIYYVNLIPGISSYNWIVPGGSTIITGQGDTLIQVIVGSNSGNIYMQFSSACGNTSSSDSLYITVHPKPAVSLTLAVDSVCSSAAPLALTGGSPNGGVYSGNGVSGGNFSAVSAGIGTHAVHYTYTDGNGCKNNATDSIVVYICAGINKLSESMVYTISPNPFHHQVSILFHDFRFTKGKYILYDNTGRIISSENFSGNSITIERNDLSSGVYSIQLIENEKIILTEKIIAQ